jgi:hypothetical protein
VERDYRRELKRLLDDRGPLPGQEPTSSWTWLPGMPMPWEARARYVLRMGRPVVCDLTIAVRHDLPMWPDIPSSGLTATHLREFAPHVYRAVNEAWYEVEFANAGLPVIVEEPPRRIGQRRKTGRPRQYTDDEVARFAAQYLTAVREAPQRPRRWLEQHWQRSPYATRDEVSDWIRRATDRGFLSAAHGAGDRNPREATDKLLAWLKAQPTPKQKGKK